uniref:Uncharacterized protein n=1 Tax=Solanum lycopersicum TaxID=4081 RepID=A0A3Q7IGR7_SOLLC
MILCTSCGQVIVESRLVFMFRLIEWTPVLRNGQSQHMFCHNSSLRITSGNEMNIVCEVADKEEAVYQQNSSHQQITQYFQYYFIRTFQATYFNFWTWVQLYEYKFH